MISQFMSQCADSTKKLKKIDIAKGRKSRDPMTAQDITEMRSLAGSVGANHISGGEKIVHMMKIHNLEILFPTLTCGVFVFSSVSARRLPSSSLLPRSHSPIHGLNISGFWERHRTHLLSTMQARPVVSCIPDVSGGSVADLRAANKAAELSGPVTLDQR